MNWFRWPFDTTGFVPRWQCGLWSSQLGWLHIISDALICLAYLAIPALILFLLKRRRDIPFPVIFWLFGAFIIACGMTHLLDALVFWDPVYRLAGLAKLSTAIISWTTVFALVTTFPRFLAMRTPTQLEIEVEARTAELRQVNEALRREVHERALIEEQLREQREWLHVILSSLGEGIVVTDEDGRVMLLNPAGERLTGLRQEDAIGRPFDDVMQTRADAAGRNGDSANHFSDSHLTSRQTVVLSRDGQERIVEQRSNPIRLADSQVAGHVLILQDVSDRIRSEESLRLRDRAIGAASQGILITDASSENQIVFASTGFQRVTGYEPHEVVGLNCRILQGPETDPIAVSRVREAIKDATPRTIELINYRKDGTPFWNELSISPIRDDHGQLTHFVGVQTDVTARKSLEDQLRQSHKIESIGLLAGGVAHDFNNMLTVINGCCDLAMNELSDESPTMPLLREVRSAGERAANLTRQLLALSRRQHVSLQTLDLNQIVTEMEQMLRRLLGETIALEIDLAPGLWPVLGDRGRKQQVLLNLVLNARDAMPDGGSLTIASRNISLDETHSRTHLGARPGEYVVLEVADSGIGLDEATKARIFEPFFTTKASGRGTGLGLTVVHGIVTQAGGHVSVESQLGQGTTLQVYFPRFAGEQSSNLESPHEPRRLPSGTETILVVEDEDGVRSFVGQALTTCGYNVLMAANGDQAMEIASTAGQPIDLLVTDVIMPGIGGSDVARQFLELHPHARVLFISGYTDDTLLRGGVVSEEVEFLDKPFTANVLAAKVRETLDRK
ncbi:MAG: PAS domain S-box protein [Pirellulales bacterium]